MKVNLVKIRHRKLSDLGRLNKLSKIIELDDNIKKNINIPDIMIAYMNNYDHNNYFNYFVIVAEYKDEVIGGCTYSYIKSRNCGFIDYVVVKEEHRNKGIGKKLLSAVKKELESEALQNGKKLHNIFCCYSSDNKSEDFCRANGFKGVDVGFNDCYKPFMYKKSKSFRLGMLTLKDEVDSMYIANTIYAYLKYGLYVHEPLDNSYFNDLIKKLESIDSLRLS